MEINKSFQSQIRALEEKNLVISEIQQLMEGNDITLEELRKGLE